MLDEKGKVDLNEPTRRARGGATTVQPHQKKGMKKKNVTSEERSLKTGARGEEGGEDHQGLKRIREKKVNPGGAGKKFLQERTGRESRRDQKTVWKKSGRGGKREGGKNPSNERGSHWRSG